MIAIATQRHATALRQPDLIAKLARVTLKDTVRVLAAAHLAAWYANDSLEDMLESAFDAGLSASRPEPDNIAACEVAYFDLKNAAKKDTSMRKWLHTLDAFR